MEELTGNSKTSFYIETSSDKFRKVVLGVLAVALVLGVIVLFSGIGSGARTALSHAKDVRVALKLVSLEFYGGDGSVYDPSSVNGLAPGALSRIEDVIPVKGDIVLTGWDYENNIPISFTYREGKYLVEYREMGNGGGSYGMNGDWTVYYDFKVMEYKAGE